jgi:hemerythrin
MLTWNQQFATGSPLIDTQHRMLIDQINRLEQLLNGPPPPQSTIDQLLTFLGSYVSTHFKFEEQCMEQHRCPAHQKNKQAHAAFLEVFSKFKARYAAEGPKPELLRSLQQAASDWIVNHILAVDVQLKTCIKTKA